jgi:hypothetical protein
VLIVSPHFPPVNAPDMQRVRMSLPHFREFGWEPLVLAAAPTGAENLDPVLSLSVPADIPVERVNALPSGLTRLLGIGNIALRAMPWLYRTGARLIKRQHIDLVYFSTTMFLSMPLGRIWRQQFGVPYVLDIQDPWLSDYYETHPDAAPPPKYGAARRLHAQLEPWTMKRVGGLIAVSDAYIRTLRRRYPWIAEERCATIPFSGSDTDILLLDSHPQPNPVFARKPAELHAVYVGRGGDDIAPALRILLSAAAAAIRATNLGRRLHLHFVGTDYATDGRARKTVEPIAASVDPQLQVHEQTARIPYFQALQVMQDADLLILVGSDDPQYTASKIDPYLLARKPIVAVVHERSSLVPLLRDAGAVVATFGSGDARPSADALAAELSDLFSRLPFQPTLPEAALRACSARAMTRAQCDVFDRVVEAA